MHKPKAFLLVLVLSLAVFTFAMEGEREFYSGYPLNCQVNSLHLMGDSHES